MRMYGGGTNFGTFNQSDAWNAGPWNTNFEKIYGNFFQIQEATNESGHYYAFARMIRAITMLRVAVVTVRCPTVK